MNNPRIFWSITADIDASDLGLKPGSWPQQLTVYIPDGTTPGGVARVFTKEFERTTKGEVTSALYTYRDTLGGHDYRLRVFND